MFYKKKGTSHKICGTFKAQIHYTVSLRIISGMEHNFDKFGADLITSFGQPYDYASIMHYTAYAFSSNGLPTITAWVTYSTLLYVLLHFLFSSIC